MGYLQRGKVTLKPHHKGEDMKKCSWQYYGISSNAAQSHFRACSVCGEIQELDKDEGWETIWKEKSDD